MKIKSQLRITMKMKIKNKETEPNMIDKKIENQKMISNAM